MNDYKSALEYHKHYTTITDSTHLKRLEQDTKYIEDRFNQQMTIIHQKLIIFFVIILCISCLSLYTISYNRKRKQANNLQYMVNELKKEYKELKKIKEASCEAYELIKTDFEKMEIEHEKLLKINTDNKISFENTQKILDKRIQSLGVFLSKDLPDSISKVAVEIEDMTKNRFIILDNIGMLYAIYHPSFVKQLTDKGLTASEIGYCCLLILGIKTSEIGSIICRSGTYNMSSGIRNKLKLTEKDTRLSIWLKHLFEESKTL